jgi:antitoxin (DNA-binding transcriptional repressor) of toxin-antitoxin stability system
MQARSHFWLSWPSLEPRVLQVNMLDAKSQLSRLVKAALAGEEVIIACHGKAQVKLVPCAEAAGLKQLGALAAASPELLVSQVDAAFAEAVDQQVAELFNS